MAKKQKAQMNAYVGAGVAASVLGVSSDSLRRWAKAGKIGYVRTPGGRFRYDLAGFMQVAQAQASVVRPAPKPAKREADVRQLDLVDHIASLPPVSVAMGPTAAELVAALLAPSAPRQQEIIDVVMPSLGASRARPVLTDLEHRDME